MKLHELHLPQTFEVPQSFRDAHYCLGDLLRLLKLDNEETGEWTFWRLYKSGRIPAGVWLPAERAAVCWEKSLIDQWIAAGMPAYPNVEAHEQRVYSALLDSVEDTLPARPVTLTEAN